MKLTTVTNVSVDGVMQGLGGPDEDRRGGFERGGWALPLFENDNEAATFLNEVYQRADAFLFGRQTYEIFAGSWGSWADPADSPIWTALNTKPKYVASTTLSDPQWADTTVFSGDVAAAIGELKAKPAAELQVHGSGSLVRWLFDNPADRGRSVPRLARGGPAAAELVRDRRALVGERAMVGHAKPQGDERLR